MSRYIDWEWYQRQVKKMHEQHPDVFMPTDGIPFPDVVEVVRCENCKHYYWDDETGHYCNVRLVETYNSDFCSDGVRKADTNSGADMRGEKNAE